MAPRRQPIRNHQQPEKSKRGRKKKTSMDYVMDSVISLKNIYDGMVVKIDKQVGEVIDEYEKELISLADRLSYDAADKLRKEAIKMYDSYIAYYYDSYHPKQYGRHGDTSGFNLYRANNIHGTKLQIIIDFSPEDLLPYKLDDRETVFDIVTTGGRGVPDAPGKSYGQRFMSWNYTYEGKYYNSGGRNMKDAFEDFENSIGELSYAIMKPNFEIGSQSINLEMSEKFRKKLSTIIRETHDMLR